MSSSIQSTKVLRVGLIGAGSVAQTVHLPTLLLVPHLFKVVALCDISPGALKHCLEKFHIPLNKGYTTSEDLVKDPGVDVVFVAHSDEYHAEAAIQAMNAGKHVFIEKPMAWSRSQIDAVIETRNRTGVVAFVGYMRRYAPAFEQAVEIVTKMKNISYVRVRDIIGKNSLFIDQSGSYPLAFDDIPLSTRKESTTLRNTLFSEILGSPFPTTTSNPSNSSLNLPALFTLLASLGSHDLSAMREILGGSPNRVIGAAQSENDNGRFVNALFEYERGGTKFLVSYETGIDRVALFDAHIEVYGDGMRVRVDWDTPFIKGLPTTLTIQKTDSKTGVYSEQVIIPTYEDNYTLEYKRLHAAIVDGEKVKTTVEDAAEDLGIFKMVIDAVVASQG
ncbi:NAD(P)-binding protein [Sistotremastrum suecicum HHB10207 ss-3]|uniref:NAD(P)-binding protein n=1 Tax=Sistotremastrum suecicum HHB10207 ss-3 TaxID=1314776 RepID=A0A165ZT53_9AGAM|nr:NAD(P)-binding protein [Sistotremastrum suecicum HHB10207 ss-3]